MKSLLTLIHVVGKNSSGREIGAYLCECGAITKAQVRYVNAGHTRSCGCLIRATKNVTHGLSKTPTYKSWASAKDRTTNPECSIYFRYGGAGITMHERWMCFSNFLLDMGVRPPRTSLDRIDGTKGYEPGNCRWATYKTQAINRRLHPSNATGLSGVFPKNNGKYRVLIQRKDKSGIDCTATTFFDACCIKMSFLEREARRDAAAY